MANIGAVMAPVEAEVHDELMEVSGELHESGQWKEQTIHYDYYTG